MHRLPLIALVVFAMVGCSQSTPAKPRIGLSASWFTDAPGSGRGYQVIEISYEMTGGSWRCNSTIILNNHENRITYMDSYGTLKIDNREVKLPDADGWVYVLDPSLAYHQVDVKAEDFKRQWSEGPLSLFLASDDWVKKLQPILKKNEWPAK